MQFTHKSEMTMFKKWSKSEISLRTAVMKIFNFWQNFDSTSNFEKWFKTTKKHFRILFWYLQFTQVRNGNVQKVVKIWNFAKESSKFSIFDKILTQPQAATNPSNQLKNTLEYNIHTCKSLRSPKWQCSKSDQNVKFR